MAMRIAQMHDIEHGIPYGAPFGLEVQSVSCLCILPLCWPSSSPQKDTKGKAFQRLLVIAALTLVTLSAMGLDNVRALPVSVVNFGIFFFLEVYREVQTQAVLGAVTQNTLTQRTMFFSTVNHDIRTYLNGIISTLEVTMLRMGTAEKAVKMNLGEATEVLDNLGICMQSSCSLVTLVNDLLDLQKMQAEMFELNISPSSPSELAQRIANVACIRAKKKGIMFEVDLDPLLPSRVMMDVFRIEQILLNLCTNGIKFTDAGSVKLSITIDGTPPAPATYDPKSNSTATTPKAHPPWEHHNHAYQGTAGRLPPPRRALGQGEGQAEVLGGDTGRGLSPQQQQLLFQPFQQLHQQEGGSGLGLVICRDLVARMGGELLVSNRTDAQSGLSFHFHLDVDCVEQAVAAPVLVTELQQELDPDLLVLLVDDDAINVKVGMRMLQLLGVSAHTATNGEQAVERYANRLREHKADPSVRMYDLVLLDYFMPCLNGPQAARLMRQHHEQHDCISTPIVALTGDPGEDCRTECRKAGMADFLTKPVRIGELRATLSKFTSPHCEARLSKLATKCCDAGHKTPTVVQRVCPTTRT
eukprot:CAMPEP_0114542658 /NCGR_PEP_ID=MMETSP0114-20121206/1947_1 /TAXON_ID=31324 /ORGANISM="Goniomonas sp, Strain m" /LENGTH=583 /DNA_ID=CAMNT_0001726959 /DNA_START=293 /DNA_END=2045 /DNA_ORIENTATION=-